MCNSSKETPKVLELKVPKIVRDKVRVSANLDPDFTNYQYLQNVQKQWKETNRKRLRRHNLRKKLIGRFLDVMRPIPVEDHSVVSESFHHVMNLLYPMVEIEKEEESNEIS